MVKAGRTLRTDGELTRNRILEAAGEMFADTGYAETTSKQIAARADVDVASINYHFGSRSGLYESVVAEAHRRLIAVDFLQELAASDEAAEDKLKKIIEVLVEAAAGNRGWHLKILGREALSPSSHLEIVLRVEALPKLQIVLRILSEITSIPEHDPALMRCVISVVAPCAWLVVAGRNATPATEEAFSVHREALAAHLFRFSLAGLEAVARDRRSKGSV